MDPYPTDASFIINGSPGKVACRSSNVECSLTSCDIIFTTDARGSRLTAVELVKIKSKLTQCSSFQSAASRLHVQSWSDETHYFGRARGGWQDLISSRPSAGGPVVESGTISLSTDIASRYGIG